MGITGWYWLLFDLWLWLSFAMEIIAGRMGMSTEIQGCMFALPHQYQSGNRVGILALVAEFPPSPSIIFLSFPSYSIRLFHIRLIPACDLAGTTRILVTR
jgi:hypothetical protein